MFPRTRQSFVAALAAIFMVLTTTLVVLQPAAPAEAGTIPSGFPNGTTPG